MCKKRNLVYHYTSVDALIGMLKNFSLDKPFITMRASNVLYLNDPTEYEYGKAICLNLLKHIERKFKLQRENYNVASIYDLMSQLDEQNYFRECEFGASSIPGALSRSTPYIACFSKRRDYLPMWTTYARNGCGVAVGFDLNLLSSNEQYSVKLCSYSRNDSSWNWLQSWAERNYELMLQQANTTDESVKCVVKYDYMFNLYAMVAVYVKHQAYSYEKEVRCRVDKAENIEYRISNKDLIPYVEFEIPIKYMREIIIGPVACSSNLEHSLKMLLRSKKINLDDIDIVKSGVPYRG